MKYAARVFFLFYFIFALAFILPAAVSELAPPQGVFVKEDSVTIGGVPFKTRVYETPRHALQVTAYYRDFFNSRGAKLLTDKNASSGKKHFLQYQEGSEIIMLTVDELARGSKVIVGSYAAAAGSLNKKKPLWQDFLSFLPTEDVAGDDLPEVPRPPASTRVMALNREGHVFLSYASKWALDDLAEFYRGHMASLGWHLDKEARVEDVLARHKKSLGIEDKNIMAAGDTTLESLARGALSFNYLKPAASARLVLMHAAAGSNNKEMTMVTVVYKDGSGAQ